MNRLLIATTNSAKLTEYRVLLRGYDLEVLSLRDVGIDAEAPEDGETFDENARIKAQFYFGIAQSDDAKQPDAKIKLKEAFEAAQLPVAIEVYAGTLHGWCVKDMPLQAGKPIYNEPEAERAWQELTALYRRALG